MNIEYIRKIITAKDDIEKIDYSVLDNDKPINYILYIFAMFIFVLEMLLIPAAIFILSGSEILTFLTCLLSIAVYITLLCNNYFGFLNKFLNNYFLQKNKFKNHILNNIIKVGVFSSSQLKKIKTYYESLTELQQEVFLKKERYFYYLKSNLEQYISTKDAEEIIINKEEIINIIINELNYDDGIKFNGILKEKLTKNKKDLKQKLLNNFETENSDIIYEEENIKQKNIIKQI
jgi:hypothetical protein